MHLLYLHQYFCPPGGSGNNRSFELARTWVQAGHRVTMVTSPAYFPEEMRSKLEGKKVLRTEVEGIDLWILNVDYSHMMGFRQRILAWLSFYRQIWAQRAVLPRPDLIYASSTPLTIGEAGRKLSRFWKIPFVFETVDVWPDVPIGMNIVKNPFLIRWLHRRTDRIYREAQAIVALSEGMKAQVCSHGVEEDKVVVVHNGTNVQAFPFHDRSANPEVPVRILYAGTVGLANGLDQLLLAARELKEHPHLRFEILGGGNDLERVKALAREWNLDQVHFLPRVPKEEVDGILARADIGVVCFAPFKVLEANSANKFYDYLASGLPVVLNYRGWQSAYLEEWDCGLSVEQGDPVAFANAILSLAEDKTKRLAMGQRGRRLAESHFDRHQLADKLMQLFLTII